MLNTPFYLIDKNKLLNNLQKIDYVYQISGAKSLLALKCFATWSVFDFMSEYMHGTTSSSLYEVKLGRKKFPGETHAYSVAYAQHEIKEVIANSDKIIFNSISQLERFKQLTTKQTTGLRVNPRVSYSHFDLADPARAYSRLGEYEPDRIRTIMPLISGFMVHNNCENEDFMAFCKLLSYFEEHYAEFLPQLDWLSLGGGVAFTAPDYPLEEFSLRLKAFAERWQLQIYLEPGEASITETATLEVTVLDVFNNGKNIAIVDASVEAHMLDLLIYQTPAKIAGSNKGTYQYMLCGKSCLAGDIFGEFNFEKPLQVGDRLAFTNAAGYTMVKKNWFNGVNMPSIVVKELDGSINLVKTFNYNDFIANLS